MLVFMSVFFTVICILFYAFLVAIKVQLNEIATGLNRFFKDLEIAHNANIERFQSLGRLVEHLHEIELAELAELITIQKDSNID